MASPSKALNRLVIKLEWLLKVTHVPIMHFFSHCKTLLNVNMTNPSFCFKLAFSDFNHLLNFYGHFGEVLDVRTYDQYCTS